MYIKKYICIYIFTKQNILFSNHYVKRASSKRVKIKRSQIDLLWPPRGGYQHRKPHYAKRASSKGVNYK